MTHAEVERTSLQVPRHEEGKRQPRATSTTGSGNNSKVNSTHNQDSAASEPASRPAHTVTWLPLTLTPRGSFRLKDLTSQMRVWRLSGPESSHGTQGQGAVVPAQPPAKSSCSHCFTQDGLFHSTREDTHSQSRMWALLGLHTHLCVCTHPHENVCARIAMCVCMSTQTRVSTRTAAESQTCVAGGHGPAHVTVYACGHVHTGMFMHL